MNEAARKRYLRRLASLYQSLAESAPVLSPRDAALLESWFERGIPLELVESCLKEALDPRKRGRRKRPRSLAYVAPMVEESWRTVLEGRLRQEVDRHGEAAPVEPQRAWSEAAARWDKRAPKLAARVLELATSVADGVLDPGDADRLLDVEIAELAPAEWRQAAREEVDRQIRLLPPHQRRHTDAEARRRRLAAVLRRRLGLPRLSLPSAG